MEFLSTVGFKINVITTVTFLLCYWAYRNKSAPLASVSLSFFVIFTLSNISGPFLYDIKGSWKWWFLYSASIDFMRYFALVKLTKASSQFREPLLVIRFGLIINIFVSLITHFNYAILKQDTLLAEYSTITKTINVLATLALASPAIWSFFFNKKLGKLSHGVR